MIHKTTLKPRCALCGNKPAKRLPIPGSYGREVFFCSLECAAADAIDHMAANCYQWCGIHKRWDMDHEGCPHCISDAAACEEDWGEP